MEEKVLPFKRIVFVCVNERNASDRVCCAARGGVALQEELKAMVKARGLKGRVRVCRSGCMDRCEQGPNVMIFPDNVWFSGVEPTDLPEIVDRIESGLL